MTLIVGVNLSDRAYLAADTRVTIRRADATTEHRDDLLKFADVSPSVHVAAAGVASFAQHLIHRLRASVSATADDVRLIRAHVEDILLPAIDDWLTSHDYAHSNACLLFAGLGSEKEKRIAVEDGRLVEMVRAAYRGELKRVEMMLDRLRDSRHASLHSAIKEILSQAVGPRMKAELLHALGNGRDTGGHFRVPGRDSHVFSIQIKPPAPPTIEDASWGELLLYGPSGVQRDEVPPEAIATLEFAAPGDLDSSVTLLTAMITRAAADHGLIDVGSGVACLVVSHRGIGVMTGEIYVSDPSTGELHHLSSIVIDKLAGPSVRTSDGQLHPLTPLLKWREPADMLLGAARA